MRIFLTVFVLGFSAAIAVAAEIAAGGAGEEEIQRLVDQLNDDSSAVRDEASRRLLAIGAAARPALERASSSAFPEVRARAAALLEPLRWVDPSDPPELRKLLDNFGRLSEQERIARLAKIIDLEITADAIAGALARIISEERSARVQWAALPYLRRLGGRALPKHARRVNMETASAPVLALAGHAWVMQDRNKAVELLERAFARTLENPPENRANAELIFDLLSDLSVVAGKRAQAAEVQRRWIEFRTAGKPPVPRTEAAMDLFSLHAKAGPLPGFLGDLRRHAADLGRAEYLHIFAHLMDRRLFPHAGEPLVRAALAMSPATQDAHMALADTMRMKGFPQASKRELQMVLALDGPTKDVVDCNAHLRLASLAAVDGEDLASGEHYRKALAIFDRTQGLLSGATREALEAEMHWHFLRSAIRRKLPDEQMKQHLDRIVALAPKHGKIVLDTVPALKKQGRVDEAKRLFGPVYEVEKRRLAADPKNPELLNNLAWLCARCDEHLADAVQYATAAIAAAPENAAYLDTAAEANFRVGNREEAIRLESRALELRPGDQFMKMQLRRFRGEVVDAPLELN